MKFLLLFFELSWHDAWNIFLGFCAALIFLGAVGGAIKNIKGEMLQPILEWFWKPYKTRREQMEKLTLAVEELTSQATRIEQEVKTNGGSSLKDVVLRVENTLMNVEKHVDYTNAKFRHHDQISKTAVFEMDENANIVLANPAFCNLLDVDEKDLTDRKWLSRIPFSERNRVITEWQDAAKNKLPVDMVYPVIIGSSQRSVRVQATPRLSRNGELRGFFGELSLTVS